MGSDAVGDGVEYVVNITLSTTSTPMPQIKVAALVGYMQYIHSEQETFHMAESIFTHLLLASLLNELGLRFNDANCARNFQEKLGYARVYLKLNVSLLCCE